MFLYFPPPKLDFGVAPLPPELAVFFGVYRSFYISPPRNWIHRIRQVAQNLVLLTVLIGFLYFLPPRNWIPVAPKRVFTKVFKPFHVPWRIPCLKVFKPSGHNSGGCKVFWTTLLEAPKRCFTKGFVMFCEVVERHQLLVKNLMLFWYFWGPFAEKGPKMINKRQVL